MTTKRIPVDLRLRRIVDAITDDRPKEMWEVIAWATSGGQFDMMEWSELTAPQWDGASQFAGLLICAANRRAIKCFEALALDAFDCAKWGARPPVARDALVRQFASSLRDWHAQINVNQVGDELPALWGRRAVRSGGIRPSRGAL